MYQIKGKRSVDGIKSETTSSGFSTHKSAEQAATAILSSGQAYEVKVEFSPKINLLDSLYQWKRDFNRLILTATTGAYAAEIQKFLEMVEIAIVALETQGYKKGE